MTDILQTSPGLAAGSVMRTPLRVFSIYGHHRLIGGGSCELRCNSFGRDNESALRFARENRIVPDLFLDSELKLTQIT